ncbi:MAG: hypothetical protein Q9165_002005 [Trypethelium subeluteriae]
MSGSIQHPLGSVRRNVTVTVTPHSTPDPYIHEAHGHYYLVCMLLVALFDLLKARADWSQTFTAGDRVEIWTSDNPVDFKHPGVNKTVLVVPDVDKKTRKPQPGSDWSEGVWAPELHAINGRWYVYVAAAQPGQGNRSHRMIVLGGPSTQQEPTSGHWELFGPIRNMPTQQWSIDGTVFWIDNALYYVYSGWPLDGRPESEKTQQLFIARMQDAISADSPPSLISNPDNPWERSGDAGINEGPQWLADPRGSFIGIVYSCAGSWTRDYKLGVLQYRGGDPLNPHSWHKWHQPLLQSGDQAHCHGPGHCSFLPFGQQLLVIFHATDNPTDGWENRKARAQLLEFRDSLPDMGGHVGTMCESLHGDQPMPSGPGGPGPSGTPGGGHHGLKEKIEEKVKEPLKKFLNELK